MEKRLCCVLFKVSNVPRFMHSKTLATRPLPIERALKTDLMFTSVSYCQQNILIPVPINCLKAGRKGAICHDISSCFRCIVHLMNPNQLFITTTATMSVIDNMKSSSSLVYCGSVRRRRRPNERLSRGSALEGASPFLDRGGDRDITWGTHFFLKQLTAV